MQMRWLSMWTAVLAVVLLGTSWNSTAPADEIQFISMNEFSGIQQRLDEVEHQLAAFAMKDDGKGKYDPGCGCSPISQHCCTSRGWTGLAEMLFLRAYESEGAAETTKYLVAPRLTVGYVGDNGLGARVRWFDYGVTTDDEDFNVYGIDAEMTGNFQLGCNWSGLLALGVRHNKFEEVDDVKFYGWGPSIAAELRRPIFNNTSLFGSARYALLIGQHTEDNFDGTQSYAELQVGAEWHRNLSGATSLFVRGALETQLWSGPANDDTQDFALFGGTFGIGIAR